MKQPYSAPTLLYSCSEQTTLLEFFQWVEDKTAVSEDYYYIVYNGHYLHKSTEEERTATFAQIGIKKETTIHLCGRLSVKARAKKLNDSA